MTDEEFQAAIEALQSGDRDGLRRIYEAYVRLIYAVVYDMLRNREEAEDITSEFFIKLVRVADVFKKGSPHRAWLIHIARNMVIDAMRKSAREVLPYAPETDGLGRAEGIIESSPAKNPVNTVEDKTILAEDMRRAMGKLSPKEKEIVDMKLLGGFKFKEIAGITGQPMGTVTWLYQQGIKKLRRCLADYEGA